MSTVLCPTRPELEDLIAGRLTVEQHEAIEAHVRSCPDCQAVVETLADPHDSFIATLHDAVDPSPLLARRPLQRALARLKSLHEGAPPGLLAGDAARSSQVQPPLLPDGTFGDFRIIRELGRGGMGIVYEAEQISLGRRVALKIMSLGLLLDQRQLQRFQNEARAAASLDHPNIVAVYGVGVERGVHYYAMRYIAGHNLAQIIDHVRQRAQAISSDNPTVSLRSEPTPTDPSGLGDLLTMQAPSDPAYLAAVVRLGIQTAEALDYAHEHGIVHRDIKPSNLMLDQAGRLWVTDFGLARVETDPTISTSGGIVGTLRYMSPEQALGKRGVVDQRSDVYALGVTLYELLTLTPIFPDASQGTLFTKIATEEPRPPRRLNPPIPRDLETIVRKAMAKAAAERYVTAREFADDLKRFLERKPIEARPISPARRAMNWVRHNRGWAAAIGVFFLACAGVALVEIRHERNRAIAAEEQQREQERENLLQEMQSIRLSPHVVRADVNWFDDGWGLVRRAAQIRKDDAVRDQAAAFLSSATAHLVKVMNAFKASTVAFDADGRRLLIGGGDDDQAKIWDSKTDEMQSSGMAGNGPVTFSPDGDAWQLVATEKGRFPLLLWDAAKRRLVRQLNLLEDKRTPKRDAEATVAHMTLTRGGAFAAASALLKDGTFELTVWNTSGGEILRQIREIRQVSEIAVSEDAAFLAAGDSQGAVTIWALPYGKPVILSPAKPTPITGLAFGPNVRGQFSNDRWAKWLLAVGDGGGTVIIWDLRRRVPMTYCYGSYYDVTALAFSPDGSTVASAGHTGGRLWDIATGRMLLELGRGLSVTGLAFYRDAKKLAYSTTDLKSSESREAVWVWELEYHRGIQTLRGLVSQIARQKVCFTADGNRIAAVSLDWRVGIWDLPSGNLRYLLDMAPGLTADNAGLAFSPDGRRLAVSAGHEAKMWDLDTGESTTWQLPEGLDDTLAFDATGKRLFLFRMETSDWNHPPYGSSSPQRQYPRVLRMRELLTRPERDLRRPGKHNPTWETEFFNRGVAGYPEASADGQYFAVAGDHGRDNKERWLKVFDGPTGADIWSRRAGGFHLDITGRFLKFSLEDQPERSLIEIPSGKLIDVLDPPGWSNAQALGPAARLMAAIPPSGFGRILYRRGNKHPLVTLGIDSTTTDTWRFNFDGSRLAWGNDDGTVTVAYLDEVQKRLAAEGLGW